MIQKPVSMAQAGASCDLAVLNGNHATVAAMMLAGKPTLQIPIFLDQALVMQAVVCQGCGLGASPTGTDPIEERLESLLSDKKFSAAAGQFAERYAGLDMCEQVTAMVDRIEQLANEAG